MSINAAAAVTSRERERDSRVVVTWSTSTGLTAAELTTFWVAVNPLCGDGAWYKVAPILDGPRPVSFRATIGGDPDLQQINDQITHARLTALCPRLPGWAGTRKIKLIWILLKQETVSDSGISWAICKSICNQQCQSTEGNQVSK